ncbi:MAG: ABC transporter substrate-binding protein [Pseudobdellovibrionaceae bacterium]|nr:ABC transporter substrate-binding protein [Bdellovibrionales bacterium]USN48998.1 MAG: ABC transporter substrate-binding protein [Pseudobdellovibrionaceae bacterium]
MFVISVPFLLWTCDPVFAAKSKTFVYCTEASPKIFNPQMATDGPTFNASAQTVYNRLVDFKRGTTEVIPSLAESWTVSQDGLTYTFDLRKDVKFHSIENYTPQRNFNAEDVIFTIDRMRQKSHPYHQVNGGVYEYFSAMEMDKIIKDIKKIGDYRVQFVLSRPEAPFLANLAMDFASILSAEYGTFLLKKGRAEDLDTTPVGTGPFVFQRYVKDSMIRYKAHPDYFLGKAKIDKLVFSITPDPTVRYQKLKRGECHFAAEPSPTDVAAMESDPNIKVLHQPGLNVAYLAINTEKPPFNDVRVRRALYHALNRKAYIDAIYLGHGEVAKNPMPPTMWGYNENTKGYDYNPDQAKSLLKQAGLAKGFEVELWTLPVSRPYNPNGKKLGELMQSDLAKVGIKAKPVTYKFATYLDKASKGEHTLAQLGWSGDNGDPDNFLNMLLSCAGVKAGSNMSRWCNKKYTDLVNQAKQTSDPSRRAALYKKAQELFNTEVPWVPIAHSVVFKAMGKNVSGYTLSPLGTENFYGVDVN